MAMLSVATRDQACDEANEPLNGVAAMVFTHLPLSSQAITLPALSKAWREWKVIHRIKERAMKEAKCDARQIEAIFGSFLYFYVPLWAAQQQRDLSDDQKRRFQLRAVAHGDVDAVAWGGIGNNDPRHLKRLCASAARGGQLQALRWLRGRGCGWDGETCLMAAYGGHLAVLQWVRANG